MLFTMKSPRLVPWVVRAEKVMRADGFADKWRWWHRRTERARETGGERGNNVVKEMTVSIKWNWRSSQQMEEQRMWPAKLLVALQAGIDGYVQSGDKKGGRMGMTDARRGRAGDRGGGGRDEWDEREEVRLAQRGSKPEMSGQARVKSKY